MTAKFKVGDKVRVVHPQAGTWEGVVTKVALADDMYEYWTTNAPTVALNTPLLAWESEMEKIE